MPIPSTIKTTILAASESERIADFDSIKIRLASPQDILAWSHGEVLKPETINYRTQKPEKDGLFSESIFGPTKDWECYCGKYKRIRYKGIVCDKCGVEVTRSVVRRERMGNITLAVPIAHIWFVRGVPSKIGMVLDISMQDLEKVIYFASFIITRVDEDLRKKATDDIDQEFKAKRKSIVTDAERRANNLRAESTSTDITSETQKKLEEVERAKEQELKKLIEASNIARKELEGLKPFRIISELTYQELSLKYGHIFEAGIGAEAIKDLLAQIDLDKEIAALQKEIANAPLGKERKLIRRSKLLQSLKKTNIRPEWMIINVLPVLPPDLRPMVQLDGGRFATSDLNDLYRRVINRNNRLKRLRELNAPEVICRNEKRMLQEAVDALIDNSARRGKTVTASTGQRRTLRSIADMLKGKQGRFRQNLLGKRIDYSGRSVIVVGPRLKLDQCGLPKVMALELFKPFVISRLIKEEYVHNVRSANRFIESGRSEVWDILESITKESYVLLNRAPTLHRLGIQAFRPVLIEGKAIQLHPLVCVAFNADFDGDQMAVHLPLTEEAKWEAKNIMLSAKNLLKPATGDPIVFPNQDMVLGCYYLTSMISKKEGFEPQKVFATENEAILAYDFDKLALQEKIKVKVLDKFVETTVGRIIFNQILPDELRFLNEHLDKKGLRKLVSEVLRVKGRDYTAKFVDDLMAVSFKYLTISGMTWGMGDLPVLKEKSYLLEQADREIDEIQAQYNMGLLTQQEKHSKVIEVWASVKDKITELSRATLGGGVQNPVYSMIESGARGSWGQTTQMMGMKGLVTSPSGETIELPVKASFKEGFDVLEYFISTHGARKGLSDIALRTANAGYLTRRLIDVSQDIVITVEDCRDKEGFVLTKKEDDALGRNLAERIKGRVVLENIEDPKTKKVIVKKNELIDDAKFDLVRKLDLESVKIRSLVTCKAIRGACAKCYGWDLAYKEMVRLGTAVGIIAAQSIGEPGTQLTMRTFHTGGVAEQDITQGLPRVEEIFEARPIKKGGILSEISGTLKIEKEGDLITLVVFSATGEEKREYIMPKGTTILVSDGDKVERGAQLSEGSLDLRDLWRLCGQAECQKYIIKEIQSIYSSQGQDLNDKHLEIIVRQMFSRVYIKDPGDTDLVTGDILEKSTVLAMNEEVKKEEKKEATFDTILLGMTKASLATSSFLAAASFQETARVLIDAAVTGKKDRLLGLKENVIIGRLIPAGTGFKKIV